MNYITAELKGEKMQENINKSTFITLNTKNIKLTIKTDYFTHYLCAMFSEYEIFSKMLSQPLLESIVS